MSEEADRVPRLLDQVRNGDPGAAAELLPLVYGELRVLAEQRMARLAPGQTLEPTALVHEAYLRLVGERDPGWDHRGHFFGAAAHAMRNVLIDHARSRKRLKRGGDRIRVTLGDLALEPSSEEGLTADSLVALDDALRRLEEEEGSRKADVVVMRFYAGMTVEQIAAALGVTTRTVDRDWRFAKAWMYDAIGSRPGP